MDISKAAYYKSVAKHVDSRRHIADVTLPALGTLRINDIFKAFPGRAYYIEASGNNVVTQNAHIIFKIGTAYGEIFAEQLDSTTFVRTKTTTATKELYSFAAGVKSYFDDTALTNIIHTGGVIELWYARAGDGAGAYNRMMYINQHRTSRVASELKVYRVTQAIKLQNVLAEPDIFIENMENYATNLRLFIENTF